MRAPKKKGTRIMKNIKMNECKVNHEENTIFVGKSFMTKASQYGTDEYKILLNVKHDFPDYKVNIIGPKKAVDKMSTKGLTREFMEHHIVKRYGAESEQHKEFKKQKDLSEAYINPYMYMRKWFVKKYPDWDGKEEERQEARKKKEAMKIQCAEEATVEPKKAVA